MTGEGMESKKPGRFLYRPGIIFRRNILTKKAGCDTMIAHTAKVWPSNPAPSYGTILAHPLGCVKREGKENNNGCGRKKLVSNTLFRRKPKERL
jgi:hypothetical protein